MNRLSPRALLAFLSLVFAGVVCFDLKLGDPLHLAQMLTGFGTRMDKFVWESPRLGVKLLGRIGAVLALLVMTSHTLAESRDAARSPITPP